MRYVDIRWTMVANCTAQFPQQTQRTSPVESLHIETFDPPLKPLKLRRNELEIRLDAESLNTLDNRDDQNYKENKEETTPTGVQLKKLEQGYMKEQRKV